MRIGRCQWQLLAASEQVLVRTRKDTSGMDRFTLAVGGGVLALIVAALAAAMLVRTSATPPDLTTPSGTALAYALAVRGGEQQAAWDLLAPSEQARLDRDRFSGARQRQ